MTSRPVRSSSAVVRMPESTSFSARRTCQPRRRRHSRKLAAEGSATTSLMGRPSASASSASAYSLSVFCRPSRRES